MAKHYSAALTTLNVKRTYRDRLKQAAKQSKRTLQGELETALDAHFYACNLARSKDGEARP